MELADALESGGSYSRAEITERLQKYRDKLMQVLQYPSNARHSITSYLYDPEINFVRFGAKKKAISNVYNYVDFIYAWLYMEVLLSDRRYKLCKLYLCDFSFTR